MKRELKSTFLALAVVVFGTNFQESSGRVVRSRIARATPTCKAGWTAQGDYCWKMIESGLGDDISWLDATKTCFNAEESSTPLVEPDMAVLKSIMQNPSGLKSTPMPMSTEYFLGITKFGGTQSWIDGNPNVPLKDCPPETYNPDPGLCGVALIDWDKEFCLQFRECHGRGMYTAQGLYFCQYKPTSPITCEAGWFQSPDQKACYKVESPDPAKKDTWNENFCQSLLSGYELATLNNGGDLRNVIWAMRKTEQIIHPNVASSQMARVGIANLTTGEFQWIDGNQITPAEIEAVPRYTPLFHKNQEEKCMAYFVNTENPQLVRLTPFGAAVSPTDCNNPSLLYKIYKKVPGKNPVIDKATAIAVANSNNSPSCLSLKVCLQKYIRSKSKTISISCP